MKGIITWGYPENPKPPTQTNNYITLSRKGPPIAESCGQGGLSSVLNRMEDSVFSLPLQPVFLKDICNFCSC